MNRFQLPKPLVSVSTLASGKTKEKVEGKHAYAERCDELLRDEIMRLCLMPALVSEIVSARTDMRRPFNASTAEALFLALPDTVSLWIDTYTHQVNWTKVATAFNNVVDVWELV